MHLRQKNGGQKNEMRAAEANLDPFVEASGFPIPLATGLLVGDNAFRPRSELSTDGHTMKNLIVSLALLAASPRAAIAQELETRLAEIDPRVYPPGSDEAKNAPLLMGKFLKAERGRVNAEDIKAWQAVAAKADKHEWQRFIARRIANLKKSLGSLPALTAEVPVHIAKTIAGDGFAIDNLLYESRPGLWVTANLYRPVPLPQSAPGILIIHSHHNGKSQGELQDMGMMWARAGCYVLIPDQLGHGERRQHPFVNEKSFPQPFKVGRQDYYFRYNLGIQLHLVGESLIGWMANDLIAGVTLLVNKPNIDPARIILLGSVAGGGDPAAVTAALDKRIQCLVPFNFGGPQPETKFPLPADADTSFNYMGSGSWESTRNLADSAPGGFLPWAIVASISPRRLIHAHEFAWDGDRDPVWKRYKQIWSWHGADDKLAVAHGRGSVTGKPPESTHCDNIGPEHRAMIHPLFKKWFGIDVPREEYKKRVPAADLICWTPELKEKLKPRMVHELAGERWEQQRPKVGESVEETNRRVFESASRVEFWKFGPEVTQDRIDGAGGPVQARRVALRNKRTGLEVLFLLLTAEQKGKTEKIVLAFSQHGKEPFLKSCRAELAGLLRNGIAICLIDLPGAGETVGRADSRNRTSGATAQSSTLRMLGGTMPLLQANALVDVKHFLQDDAAKRERDLSICLWTESFAKVNGGSTVVETPRDVESPPFLAEPLGFSAALVYFFGARGNGGDSDCRGLLARGGLVSFSGVLKSPFIHVSEDSLELALLRGFENEDYAIAAYRLAKDNGRALNPVRLEGLVDGSNRVASQAEIDRSFARFQREFGEMSRIALRAERSNAEDVVRWFVKCFE